MNHITKKSDGLVYKITEIIICITLMNLGFYLSFLLKFNMNPPRVNLDSFIHLIPYISIAVFIIFSLYDFFSMLKKPLIENITTIFISVMAVDFITLGIAFLAREFSFPRSIFLTAFIFQIILLSTFKMIALRVSRHFYKKKEILVIGGEQEVEEIARKIIFSKRNLDYVTCISDTSQLKLYEMIDGADKVYVGSIVGDKVKAEIISYCIGKGKATYMIPELLEIILADSKIEQLDDIPICKIESFHLSVEKAFVKRIFDIFASLCALIIFALPMLIVAVAIKLHDKGPVLLAQERITIDNKKFDLYKFRTMIIDAEKHTGPVLAQEDDPRVTPLGKALRMIRLDEFPQFFNVLKGDMSMVGPRPEREHFIDQVAADIPEFAHRTICKAGITGLAQIRGKYTTLAGDKLSLDLLYIKNHSLLGDVIIILKTIKTVFIKERSDGFRVEQSLKNHRVEKQFHE